MISQIVLYYFPIVSPYVLVTQQFMHPIDHDKSPLDKPTPLISLSIIEGSLEVKLPTIYGQMKSRAGQRQREEESRREKIREEKESEEEDADARKGRKVAKHCVFPMIWGSGGSKSRLAKAAGAEPAGQMRDEKLHAYVARSTCRSQNVQNTPLSDHFWKLRCRKIARRRGPKHISKSKCTKHTIVGPLWDVEKVLAVVARSTFRSQNVQSTPLSDHFWKLRCRKSAVVARSTFRSQKCKKLKGTGYGALLDVQMSFRVAGARDCAPCQKWAKRAGFVAFSTTTTTTPHYTPIHYTTTTNTTTPSLHSTTLHSTALHYTTLNYTQLHYTTLHHVTLHSTPLRYLPLHYTTFHYTSLHYTTLHSTTLQLQLHNYTPLHSTTLNYTTLRYITLHYTTFHYTPLHYITLHYITLNDTEPQIGR